MLFDDNFSFGPFDLGMLTKDDFTFNKTYDVLNPEEGFLRGNMYKNEFKPYKNYTYRKISPVGKRNQLLFEIMQYDFAINDLNLVLDLHPDDERLLDLFKKYVAILCEKELEYVKLYGPLQVMEADGKTFNWISEPWPWNDREEAKYV